jgi:putative membrane protein
LGGEREAGERYLILCVDRDDDLGRKGQIETPIIGRDAVVGAATKLGLADPEEADTNAIFAAVKKYDELAKRGVACDVAVVCGDENGGFDADRKIRSEVGQLLSRAHYSGFIFVSDGGEDEQVMPVLQSIEPIVSVERIAIKHSETVEQTYLVLGRYLRMLVFDPRYSKWFLGVPGLIVLLAVILIVSGQSFLAGIAALVILGGAFFIRGFNVDRWFAGILSQGPYGYIRLFSTVTSLLVIVVGLSTGYSNMNTEAGSIVQAVTAHPSRFLADGGILVGYFLTGALLLVWVGLAVYATGALLAHLVRASVNAWRDAVVLVMLALLYFPIGTFATFLINRQRASEILLISYVLLGLALIFGVTSVLYPRIRTRTSGAPE